MLAVRLRLLVLFALIAACCVPIAINHIIEGASPDPTSSPDAFGRSLQRSNLDADLRAAGIAAQTTGHR